MKTFAKKAFTIIEVNLAILILSSGVLALISLFALGFRENRQSREDVGSAAFADAVISRIVMAASSPNIEWDKFRQLGNYPSGGWKDYYGKSGSEVRKLFETAFNDFMSALGAGPDVDKSWPAEAQAGLFPGLVIVHERKKDSDKDSEDLIGNKGKVIEFNGDSAMLKISFRAGRHASELLSQPIYYTEVRFQGKVK